MPQPQFSQQAAKLQHLLDRVSPVLARQSGFVKRHSKLTGDIFIKSLVLGWLKQPTASLSTLTQQAAELGVCLSPQGLAQRFSPSTVAYAQTLFAQTLQSFQPQDVVKIPLLTQFTGVYLLDSTSMTLPAALQNTWTGCGGPGAKAGLKMHLTFEYLRGQISAIDLTESKRSDRLYAPPRVPTGSLHLFDLGYFKLETFEQLDQQQAFFISRLRSGSVLSVARDQKPLDVAALCQSFRGMNMNVGCGWEPKRGCGYGFCFGVVHPLSPMSDGAKPMPPPNAKAGTAVPSIWLFWIGTFSSQMCLKSV